MIRSFKNKLVMTLCFLFVLCLGILGVGSVINVSASIDSFAMADGASIRYSSGSTGIRYTAVIDDSEYTTLLDSYKTVTFGMVVLPYECITDYNPINKTTLFGIDGDAKYCWGGKQEGKVQILNFMTTDELSICNDSDCEYYGMREFRCAMTNIEETNYSRNFYAKSYIITETTEGEKDYIFSADNSTNVRAIAQVAQLAYEKESVDTSKKSILDSFINKAGSTYSYNVEYYVPSSDGYELYTSEKVDNIALNTLVTATILDIDGYVYDDANTLNKLNGNVLFDNSLTLKVYYKNWKEQPVNLLQGFENTTIANGAVTNNAGTLKPVSINTDANYVNGGDSSLKIEYGADQTNMHLLIESVLPSRNLSSYSKFSFDIMTTVTTYVGKASIYYTGSAKTSAYTITAGSSLTKNTWRTITFDLAAAKAGGIDLTNIYSIYVNLGNGGTFYIDNFRVEYDDSYLQTFENFNEIQSMSVTYNNGSDASINAFINTDTAYVASGRQSLGFTSSGDATIHLVLSKLLSSNDLSIYDTLSFKMKVSKQNYIGSMTLISGADYSTYSSGSGTHMSTGAWHTITIDLAKLREENPNADLTDAYSIRFYMGATTFYIDDIIAE